jgi:hypothetical protein
VGSTGETTAGLKTDSGLEGTGEGAVEMDVVVVEMDAVGEGLLLLE